MRTRDELFDALDRLPRPVQIGNRLLYFNLESVGDPGSYVSSISSAEEITMREYFNALPAEEKVS